MLGCDLALGQAPSVDPTWRVGQRYAWLYGDLAGLADAASDGTLTPVQSAAWALQILRAAWRADIHLTFSIRDPRPTLCTYAARLRRQA